TAGSYGNEGLILLGRREEAGARAAFERALSVDPNHAASLWNLSQLLEREGDARAADGLRRRALSAGSPDAAVEILRRARERMASGQCRNALSAIGAVADADPRNALAPAAEGLALMCLGDRDGAAAALRRSLTIDPDQPEILRALQEFR